MQAIEVKYLGPTETKGSRWKAECERGSITVPYEYSKNADENAEMACYELCFKFANEDAEKYGTPLAKNPWLKKKVFGQIKNGNRVFVFV